MRVSFLQSISHSLKHKPYISLEDDPNELEDVSDGIEIDDSVPAPTSVRTLDAPEPDVPPPPYSSHDPSISSDAGRDAEINLRTMLEKLRISSKQAEVSLQSSISALKRANDKLTREDQRHRQRIHMLEDSTARLKEVAIEEDAESESIHEAISDLETNENTLYSRLEGRRAEMEGIDRQSREDADKSDAEIIEQKERLERISLQEEEVLAKKLKLEREMLPNYNIQLVRWATGWAFWFCPDVTAC